MFKRNSWLSHCITPKTGLPVQVICEQLGFSEAERADVKLAVDYTDLPLRYEVDPLVYPDDVWHLHEESAEIVGQRLADATGDFGSQVWTASVSLIGEQGSTSDVWLPSSSSPTTPIADWLLP